MQHKAGRRRFLRGVFNGASLCVGLPLLDVFLNDNGNALADGKPLPTCFGTWFWGLGFSQGFWEPAQSGQAFSFPKQLQALTPIQDKINIFSGTEISLQDGGTGGHYSGPQGMMAGAALPDGEAFGRTIDYTVAEGLSVRTRFPSLTVTNCGNSTFSWSCRGGSNMTPAEVSPLALYQRIFGAGFRDPNAADFTPDPKVIARKSALSFVKEERLALHKKLGATDRTRLDDFFSSLRDLEERLSLELEKPAPLPACEIPGTPTMDGSQLSLDQALESHDLFARLITYALACGQTRVFNMAMHRDIAITGEPANNHVLSHEEVIDPELGYQRQCYWFAMQYMNSLQFLVKTLDSVKEGDGTLLDRSLVLAYTDCGDARIHDVSNIPVITAGRAGGGMKTGYHVAASGALSTRVGFTCLRALGIAAESWGTLSNKTSDSFSEVLA